MVKKKLKALLPSLKERKRYLAFRITSKTGINDFNSVTDAISQSYLRLFGEIGMAKAGIQILKERWNPINQSGLIRVGHKHVDELKSALVFIKTIDNQEAIVSSLRVSGMINKAEKNI